MIRVSAFLMVLMIAPAMAGKVDASYCAQAPDVAAARLRSALTLQQNSKFPKDDSCRGYRNEFYEAAVMRQNVTHCEQGDIRQHALQVIDAEIDAFNDLIANSCGEGIAGSRDLNLGTDDSAEGFVPGVDHCARPPTTYFNAIHEDFPKFDCAIAGMFDSLTCPSGKFADFCRF